MRSWASSSLDVLQRNKTANILSRYPPCHTEREENGQHTSDLTLAAYDEDQVHRHQTTIWFRSNFHLALVVVAGDLSLRVDSQRNAATCTEAAR